MNNPINSAYISGPMAKFATEASKGIASNLVDGQGITESLTNGLVDAGSKVLQDAGVPKRIAEDTAQKVADVTKQTVSSGGSGSIGGGSSKSEYYANYGVNTLNVNNPVDPIFFNSGIQNNVFGDIWTQSSPTFSAMHLSFQSFRFPVRGRVQEYFDKIVFYQLTNAVQNAISFRLPDAWDLVNVREYYDLIFRGLLILYSMNDTLAIASNRLIKNDGINTMKRNIGANDITAYQNLRLILDGTPIPPNLNMLAFFLTQTYASSENSGCSLLKIMPLSPVSNTDTGIRFPWETEINSIITGLNSINPRKVANVLSRAYPQWMTSSCNFSTITPTFSPNFLTLWTNLPFVWINASNTIRQYSFTDVDSEWYYNSYTNQLDGAILGLSSGFWEGVNQYYPSIVEPLNFTDGNLNTNRYSFDWIGPYPGTWKPFSYSHGLLNGRGESVTLSNIGTESVAIERFTPFGSAPVLGVSVRNLEQMAFQTVEWMSSVNTVPIRTRIQRGKRG